MFDNKCAIVTGGANGIGAGLVQRLVSLNCNVVFGDIDEVKGKLLESQLNKENVQVAFAKCDVTLSADIRNLFQVAKLNFGGFQILINNAGIAPPELIETANEKVTKIIDINLSGVVVATSIAIQHFLNEIEQGSQQSYSILNISSMSAISPLATNPVYSATKAGILAFTNALEYLGTKNIHINCMAPTFIATNLTSTIKYVPYLAETLENIGGELPITKFLDSTMSLLSDTSKSGQTKFVGPKFEGYYRDLSEDYNIVKAKLC